MSGQRGSALVGTIALSLVLTISAAGFILVTGNGQGTEKEGLNELQLFNAAESGLLMGARWLRANTPAEIDGFADPSIRVLTTGMNGFAPMEGFLVRVFVRRQAGTLTVVSQATPAHDARVRQLQWRVDAYIAGPGAGLNSTLDLRDWTESSVPYTPIP